MSLITESNVEDYRTEHECDEHWELRRKFLLAHAEKFELEELMCLAQTFTNVEFLGCRYPAETMQMIAELSKDVVQDYREKQKTRLRRTFVGASDAASSKVKGRSGQDKNQQKQGETSQKSYPTLTSTFNRQQDQPSQSSNPTLTRTFKRQQDQPSQSSYVPDVKRRKPLKGPNAEIVLFEYLNDSPQSIISRASSSFNQMLDFNFDNKGGNTFCTIFFNRKIVGKASGINQKEAKQNASTIALEEMQKHYYTIKVTKNLTPTINDNMGTQKDSNTLSDAIGNDNVGSKMMKLMGWSGGGLGKKSQGIVEPVSVQQQMTREGLGLKPGMYNMHVFKKKCTEVLQNYIKGDTTTDLVFNPSFSNDERAMIHQIAKQLGLKSQSYGPKAQRILTISRKIRPIELVEELLQHGGSTEKYQLIEPTGN